MGTVEQDLKFDRKRTLDPSGVFHVSRIVYCCWVEMTLRTSRKRSKEGPSNQERNTNGGRTASCQGDLVRKGSEQSSALKLLYRMTGHDDSYPKRWVISSNTSKCNRIESSSTCRRYIARQDEQPARRRRR